LKATQSLGGQDLDHIERDGRLQDLEMIGNGIFEKFKNII